MNLRSLNFGLDETLIALQDSVAAFPAVQPALPSPERPEAPLPMMSTSYTGEDIESSSSVGDAHRTVKKGALEL